MPALIMVAKAVAVVFTTTARLLGSTEPKIAARAGAAAASAMDADHQGAGDQRD